MTGVELELLRQRLDSVVEDMARVAQRTALSTYLKETADFTTAIVSPGGEFVSYPWQLGASVYLGLNLGSTLALLRDPQPGDVYVCNDPYLGGPACTHLPDLQLFRPLFVDGSLLCWLYAFVHATDVGGIVPSSVSAKASEVHQEGIRLRPVKLWRQDRVAEEILHLVLDNTRVPDSNWGDLKAVYAALLTGQASLVQLVERFGRAHVAIGIDGILDSAELEARSAFRAIPDGSYTFTEYLDTDQCSDVPVRIRVRLTADDGRITVDFTGSDPQVDSALNLVTGETAHPFLCLALISFLITERPSIPKCSAVLRPVRVVAPRGTVVNAQYPSAMSLRMVTSFRVADAVLGALAKACPGKVPAGSSGTLGPVAAAVRESDTGRRTVQTVEPLIGGCGGRPHSDGLDGVEGVYGGFLRNTPIEVVEQESQVVVRRYGLVPDSGGAGEHRGGLAVELAIEALHPDTRVISRGLERFVTEPWGLDGGTHGTPGRCTLRRVGANDTPLTLLEAGDVVLQPGDVVTYVTAAGGGYGDPARRELGSVVEDIENGVLGLERAARDYGVAPTASGGFARAAGFGAGRRATGGFDFGPGRRALEERWPPQVQDLLQDRLQTVEPAARNWVKHRVFAEWTALPPEARADVAGALETAWRRAWRLP